MPASVDASALLDGVTELGARLMTSLGDEFVSRAKQGASRRTGELEAGITADPPSVSPEEITLDVHSSAEHSKWQDEGTGIYGPEGTPITSTRPGGVLVFDWPAAGGIVFARSVKGSPGTRFWTNTLEAWPQIVRTVSVGG